jgi:hypothetical protein
VDYSYLHDLSCGFDVYSWAQLRQRVHWNAARQAMIFELRI